MSKLNNTDLGAFSGVWVFCEQHDGKLVQTDFELLSEGRKLADDLDVELVGLLLGDNVQPLAKELGGYGADKVCVCEHALLKDYTTDAYTNVICDVVVDKKPEIMLFGATSLGRDLGPRCAARLHTGLTADCTHLDIDVNKYKEFLRKTSTLNVDGMKWDDEEKNLKMTRPAFGGHLMATIVCPRFRPQLSTVRPGVMECGDYCKEAADRCVIEKMNVNLSEDDIRTKVIDIVKQTKQSVDLIGAEIIVSVGHGIGKNVNDGIKLASTLAEALGGVLGASRAVVDAGWLPSEHQVGQTGKTVRPRVYIALGISGAIQHKAGMQDSDCIIAVNTNPNAPIFEISDYGIVGDLFTVVPMMIEEFKR